eukprot:g6021.t2
MKFVQCIRRFCSTFRHLEETLPSLYRHLTQLESKHVELTDQLSRSPSESEVLKIHKELAKMEPVLSVKHELDRLKTEVSELELLNKNEKDQEMQNCISEELELYRSQITSLHDKLMSKICPVEPEDNRDVILEVHAGVGGLESSLFALELFQMYQKYSQLQNWKSEIMELSTSEMGGIKFASLSLSGRDVFGKLKMENGVHRVQRVPLTEKAGRVQTSAVSVVVMQQPADIEVKLIPDEIRIDVYRSSGAGGQHVNTTESAVRLTHKPTKITVAIQDERSQHKNKEKAMKVLKAKLHRLRKLEQEKELSSSRKDSIGTGDRSERIRTYNYPQVRLS